MPRFRITRPDVEPTEIEADHSSFADAWFTFWGDADETIPLLLVRRDEGARIEELPARRSAGEIDTLDGGEGEE